MPDGKSPQIWDKLPFEGREVGIFYAIGVETEEVESFFGGFGIEVDEFFGEAIGVEGFVYEGFFGEMNEITFEIIEDYYRTLGILNSLIEGLTILEGNMSCTYIDNLKDIRLRFEFIGLGFHHINLSFYCENFTQNSR